MMFLLLLCLWGTFRGLKRHIDENPDS